MLRRVVRALVAVLVLLLIVAGMPLMLVLTIGDPRTGLADLLAGDVSDRAVLGVLAVTAWLAWGHFAASVAVEVYARLRQISPPHLSGAANGPQALARALVTAVFLVGPLASSAPALTASTWSTAQPGLTDAPPALGSRGVSAITGPGHRAGNAAPSLAPAGASKDVATAEVVIDTDGPRTFWDLAQTYLGDGQRWAEIWDLNVGRLQNDGHRLRSAHILRPGWTVLIPIPRDDRPAVMTGTGIAHDSAEPAQQEASASPGAETSTPLTTGRHEQTTAWIYRVAPGDRLGDIAKRFLGSFDRYPQIVAATDTPSVPGARPAGHAVTDADHIEPGWELRLPAHAQDHGVRPHATGHVQDRRTRTPQPRSVHPAPTDARPKVPGPTPHPPPASTAPRPRVPEEYPPGAPVPAPDAQTRTASPQASEPAHDSTKTGTSPGLRLDLPSGGFAGLALATGVAGVVAMARARRRRRDFLDGKATFHLPIAHLPSADPDVIQVLHHAGNALYQRPGDESAHQELTPPPAAAAPPSGTSRPTMTGSGPVLDDMEAGSDTRPPHPRAVSCVEPLDLGVHGDRPLRWDPTRTRGIALGGAGTDGVSRALLLAMLTRVRHPRTGPSLHLVIPQEEATRLFGPQFAENPPPLVRVVDDLDHGIDVLEDTLTPRRRHLRQSDTQHEASDPAAPSRASGPDPDWPWLVLVADPDLADAGSQELLEAIATIGRRIAVSVVLLATRPWSHSFEIDGSGNVTGQPGTRLFTLTHDDARAILDVTGQAFSPSRPPGIPAPLPGAPETASAQTPPQGGDEQPGEDLSTDAATSIGVHPGTGLAGNTSPTASRITTIAAAQPDSPPEGMGRLEPTTPQRGAVVRHDVESTNGAPRQQSEILADWKPVLLATTTAWEAPISVTVLGQLRLHTGPVEIRHGLRGKSLELLLLLLMNPAGISSESIADALWPATTQPASALRSAVKRLRAQLRNVTGMGDQMFIIFASGRYRPDRRIMVCDAWQFEAATQAATDVPTTTTHNSLVSTRHAALSAVGNPDRRIEDDAPAGAQRLTALREAVALYGGTLLDGFDYPWLEPYRQALRHHALHVFVRYAATIADTDPESALAALERALPIDPVNETLYRRVMRLQARQGRPEAIAGTLALLRRQLEEIDERPDRQTLTLAATLSSRNQDPDD